LRNGILALRCVVAMSPELQAMDAGIREVSAIFRMELDDAGSDVTAADIDRQDAVMAGEYPRRNQMDAPDETGVVGSVTDRGVRLRGLVPSMRTLASICR
jgi:hypothetical protein